MEIKYTVTMMPEALEDLENVLKKSNEIDGEVFELSGKFAVAQLVNLEKEDITLLEKFAKDNACHMLVSWISDDISEMGLSVYNNDTKSTNELTSSLVEDGSLGITTFLIFCGLGKYLDGVLF